MYRVKIYLISSFVFYKNERMGGAVEEDFEKQTTWNKIPHT